VINRIVRACISLWIVTIVTFVLSRASGDPVRLMVAFDATEEDIALRRRQLGLDGSILDQYLRFLGGLLRGDLGTSIRFDVPARELIMDRLGNTLPLAVLAIIVASAVAVPIGVLAAHRPRGIASRVASFGSLAGQSIPTFVVGTMLVLMFAIYLPIFPTSNKGGLTSYVLPTLTLAWFATAAITRITRSSVREALDSPYVVAARSKGLPTRSVLFRHALRNAGSGILTVVALQLVLFANGAAVVETIFNWPGIGSLTVQAAFARDFPLVQAIVVFTASITIAVNLLTDISYSIIDRRITHGESH
jgi:peptide/nickel transport system permease protein